MRTGSVFVTWFGAVALTGSAAAATLRVPEDYPTIQEAIDAAEFGDIVLVAPGTYSEHLSLYKNRITLRSSGGPQVTILDGGGMGTGLTTDKVYDGFQVDGFTFQNFDRGIRTGLEAGENTSIEDCIFTACGIVGLSLASYDMGSITVERCTFRDNVGIGLSYGGDSSLLVVRDSTFERNGNGGARLGGSLGADPGAAFQFCVFRDNIATSGAGILADNCSLGVQDCIFEGNVAATDGGALFWVDYVTGITRCTFRNNSAGQYGGAIAARNSIFGGKMNTLSNCYLFGNEAPVGPQIALRQGEEGLMDTLTVACSVVEDGPGAVDVAKEWDLIWHDTSHLQSMSVNFGTLLSGEVMELTCSDVQRVQARSHFGFTSAEPNVLDLRVRATSPVAAPFEIDLTIEGRISQNGGLSRLRLRNWNTDVFEQVHQYSIGTTETVEMVTGIAADNRVRQSDGRITLSLRQSVMVVFTSAGFQSFTDWVQIVAR